MVAVLRRVLPAGLVALLAAVVLWFGTGEAPSPLVAPVYGHDMLDVVSPLWMRLVSQALAGPVLWVAVITGLVALLWVALLDGARSALLGGLVWLGATLTVEAIKRGIVPVGGPQLSGHTVVVSGAVVAVVLAVRAGRHLAVAILGAAVVALVGVAVVVVGWHTPAQAVAPVLLTVVWLALLRPWEATADHHDARPGGALPVDAATSGPPDARGPMGRNSVS